MSDQQATQFLAALFPDVPPDERVTTFTGTVSTSTHWTDIRKAAAAVSHDQKHDKYVAIGTRRAGLDSGHRGGNADVRHVGAIWIDVDIAGPGHATEGVVESEEAAHELVAAFPLPPSIVVHTGGGLHVYWLFAEMVSVDEFAPLLDDWRNWWLYTCDRLGKPADESVWTIDRVLRVPGTMNCKVLPFRPVVLEHCDPDRRYGVDDIAQFLGTPDEWVPPTRRSRSTGGSSWRDLADSDLADLPDELVATWEIVRDKFGGRRPQLKAKSDGTPYLDVVRPLTSSTDKKDERAGFSASIGFVGPDVLYVRTNNWRPFVVNSAYGLEDLALLDATSEPITATDLRKRLRADYLPPVGVQSEAEDLFDKSGLLHTRLRERVLAEGDIRAGLGRGLWRYRNGVWLADGDDEARRRAGRILGNKRRQSHVEGVVKDLECQEPFITDDPPTEWVNCRNGLLDWFTGELRPHSPTVPSTYQLAIGWDPGAECPLVDRWLAAVFPEDAIELAWEVIGVAIYADMPVHRAVLLHGPGRNGKGTYLRLIQKLIPQQHRSSVTLQALGEDRFMAAELYGKVANIAGDLDARSVGRTDIFKMATGGDPIPAQRKFGAPFQFYNRATMLFSANSLPGTADLSDGFFSRFVVVPMDRVQLGPGDEDKSLEPRMWAELPGVLVKAVDGLRRVMINNGFTLPQSVLAAGAEYRVSADPIMQFIEEHLEVTGDSRDRERRSVVFDRYRSWCEINGIRFPGRASDFYRRLPAVTGGKVHADLKSSGIEMVTGASLRPDHSRSMAG